MHDDTNEYSTGMAAFLAGAFIGAGIALLLAPQSGAETRNLLRTYANRARDEMAERGRQAKETFDSAYERGKEAFESVKERGKEAFETAKERGKEGLDTAKDRARETYEAGRETMKNR